MGDPFEGGWVWSRTDDWVIAVTSPSCVGYLRTEVRRLSRSTARRLAELGSDRPPPSWYPDLRVIVHARAERRYGSGAHWDAPDVEIEALRAMAWQYGLVAEVLPHVGGVIELPSHHHEGALLALLSDLREVLPRQADRAQVDRPDHHQLDAYVRVNYAISHDFGVALKAWHANSTAAADPPAG
ncbi:MAG: hypothetical protein ACRDQB_07725 [Thermocrispum sp.]